MDTRGRGDTPAFDRAAFGAALATCRLGRTLVARAVAGSTNDVAWEALAAGAPDGTAVVADAQTSGRGRNGRRWHHAPGRALALSVLLHPGGAARPLPALPLVAGLALARALDGLGARVELKWPNDLLLGGRKVSGILAEGRAAAGGTAAVLGVGVNVGQSAEDFPPELRATATSLAEHGVRAGREAVAAAFLNAFEPLWDELLEGGRAELLTRWRARAGFWGRAVRVRAPGGEIAGVARDLDAEGGLVVEVAGGARVTVLAGDVAVEEGA
uniref:biotin--[biotin carboxyl-carrier protein] ligase n=1 Tax=Eiseniibacteriota bacterium TaxID=2212470 RepID=A0A832HZ87_UNCEI